MRKVTVGRLSLELLDYGVMATLCVRHKESGAEDEVKLGAATGTRLFNELTDIKAALVAARDVCTEPSTEHRATLILALLELDVDLRGDK